MYRTSPDPLLVVPGEGVRGILVGCAAPGDVLATFGKDAQVCRYEDGDVFKIDYDYADEDGDEYEPSRPAQSSRPCKFVFEYGLLQGIDVGAYQKELYTAGGVRIGSTRADVLRAFGPEPDSLTYRGDFWTAKDNIETLRYLSRGIQFAIHHDGHVRSFLVFYTRRPG